MAGMHSWIENSDVVSLFPTLAWKIQLRAELRDRIAADALGLLHGLRQGQAELKTGEAWQSGHALHQRDELRALCDCVGRAAASVLQFLKVGEPAIEITGCWMNLYAPGAETPVVYTENYRRLPDDPQVEMSFDHGPGSVIRIEIDILNNLAGETAEIHIREVRFH